MLKRCVLAVVAALAYIGMASAHGGGAGLMPMTSYTDLPGYHPQPTWKWIKPVRKPVGSRQGFSRDR